MLSHASMGSLRARANVSLEETNRWGESMVRLLLTSALMVAGEEMMLTAG
jgi:hypothetical protein